MMQRLATVYTERFRMDCECKCDCGGTLIVTVARERGNPDMTVAVEHSETDRLTDKQHPATGESVSAIRFHQQHAP